ncbi:hypothetical protein NKR19_g1026 [Coniochaeta hoffmannii]|uniref:DUF6590 domain-containing protein n=1 Tax=Coniochaeta hoffmannii TaxID=91930 RepID=A0AA38S1Q1_9PEZI|nr:hypothetical protein NKR19_g1026 [Coniochaeta hoffmannii]
MSRIQVSDPRYETWTGKGFEPGQVFRILWYERQEQLTKSSVLSQFFTEQTLNAEQACPGLGGFIIVANGDSHCTCVPILTNIRQGCLKQEVNLANCGIVHEENSEPRLLEGEPELGFPPVRMTITASGEALARVSRVDYSKLLTVKHNVMVFFIGKIVTKDFLDVIQQAVDKCWEDKKHVPGTSGRASKVPEKDNEDANV